MANAYEGELELELEGLGELEHHEGEHHEFEQELHEFEHHELAHEFEHPGQHEHHELAHEFEHPGQHEHHELAHEFEHHELHELENEFEQGEEFFKRIARGIGRFVKRAAPILKQIAKVAAPMVGTAIGGPIGACWEKLPAPLWVKVNWSIMSSNTMNLNITNSNSMKPPMKLRTRLPIMN